MRRWHEAAAIAAAAVMAACPVAAGGGEPDGAAIAAECAEEAPAENAASIGRREGYRAAAPASQEPPSTEAPDRGPKEAPSGPEDEWEVDISEEDGEMLMRLAEAEAGNQSVEGKAMVMLVVLNRVESDAFPETVGGVITQSHGGCWQFETAMPGGGYWSLEPDEECAEALELVRFGWDQSQGALYFESCRAECWQSANCEYLFTLGGHEFYK